MIQEVQEKALFLNSNTDTIFFENDDLRTKSATCCGWLSHDKQSSIYKIIDGGVYNIEYNSNITSLTAGVVAIGLFEDGVLVPGTEMIATIAAPGDYENISFSKKLRVCCKSDASLSLKAIDQVSVYSAATPVITETEVPIITNANFSITKIYG